MARDRATPRLRLRPDQLRRDRRERTRRARSRPKAHPDRALRPDGNPMTGFSASTLDGNAIAGQLAAVFGEEMTTATGTCAGCGASAPVATFAVYTRAPGTVARCRECKSVLLALVTIREITCVDLR